MNRATATATLPAIVAIVGVTDCGPCTDGEMSGHCPHCGAGGRYIWHFICADGTRRGAMRGCLALFPREDGRSMRLVQEAFDRQEQAARDRKPLASWWQDIINAAVAFGALPLPDHDEIVRARAVLLQLIQSAESRRQTWLHRNGYGRGGRRR